MSDQSSTYGRVDEANNVFVFENGTERKVGQYPGVSGADALAYFERKYSDLDAQVRIFEQRVANKVDTHGLRKALQKIVAELVEPAAVGDLADLRRRVANLDLKVTELTAQQKEQSREVIAQSITEREQIAAAAEKIAQRDVSKIQWKSASAEMTKLFERWQTLQKEGPKLAKSVTDPIWKRFSTARTKFEANKRHFFASLDATNKASKAKKIELVKRAEALAERGADAASDYRKLLDEWKAAAKGSGKTEENLWLSFKAAGDKIYAAKSEADAIVGKQQAENLKLKLEILKDAAAIDPSKDLAEAKRQLAVIQQRWEKAGKVPREKIRETEDKLRAIESKVRDAEQENWRKTDPAAKDRTNSVLSQLEESIAKLEAELAAAKVAKNKKAEDAAAEALKARKAWLEVVMLSAN